jgi:mono/diheme cytochrome c family protein
MGIGLKPKRPQNLSPTMEVENRSGLIEMNTVSNTGCSTERVGHAVGQTFQERKRRFTMKSVAIWAGVLLSVLLFSTGTLTMAQQSQTTIKKTPIKTTSATSGEAMFNSYCAACHGKDAKGNGPAAAALKVPPPDLTTLSQHQGGKYPAAHVESVLRFGAETYPAHGTKEMPIWGPLLGSISGGINAPQVTQRIYNLNQYIESLQAK